MSCRIQVTVDEHLNKLIKDRARQIGLSVSSYARLVLMSVLSQQDNKLLDKAIKDIGSNQVQALTLTEFNQQLNMR